MPQPMRLDSREGDGPKLVKRDAPLVPGDRLKGGQYISFCTSIISTGCEAKFFEVNVALALVLAFASATCRFSDVSS